MQQAIQANRFYINYRFSLSLYDFFYIDPAIDIKIFSRENVVRKQISTT